MEQRNSRLIGGIYQVGQMITSGPLVATYTAYNRNNGSVVGLLVISLPPAVNPYAAGQLLAPLARWRPVQSPHVIRIYDWGISEGKAYIATDPPRGITLRQLMDVEHIDLARALDLTIQMTRGVAALQANSIVDIDLRPQLITVDTIGRADRVQLDDVNLRLIVRQLGYVQGQNVQDIEYLDPRYMAPENIYQGVIGSASDVYQLGILFFELITGRPPFVGRTPAETATMQRNSPVPRMVQFKHDLPLRIQEIVDRAMAKDPGQRYRHAAAMLSELEKLAGNSTISGEWPSTTTKVTPGPESTPAAPTSKSESLTTEMASLTSGVPIEAMDTLIASERTLKENLPTSTLVPEGAPIYAYLDYEPESGERQRLSIKEVYVIVGRTDPKRGIVPEIDLTAFDPQATISRQHARIRFERTFFYIEDLKSRNKTRLGELVLKPLKPELLQHGDVISFGSVKMTFRIPGEQDMPVPKNLP